MSIPTQDRNSAIAIHLSALLCLLLPGFGQFIGPLVAWLLLRERSPLLDEQGKAAVNFQVSMFIYLIVASGLLFAFAATAGMLDESGAARLSLPWALG